MNVGARSKKFGVPIAPFPISCSFESLRRAASWPRSATSTRSRSASSPGSARPRFDPAAGRVVSCRWCVHVQVSRHSSRSIARLRLATSPFFGRSVIETPLSSRRSHFTVEVHHWLAVVSVPYRMICQSSRPVAVRVESRTVWDSCWVDPGQSITSTFTSTTWLGEATNGSKPGLPALAWVTFVESSCVSRYPFFYASSPW